MAQTSPQTLEGASLESFDWLRNGARGPGYVSHSSLSDGSACAFEFGADGYAGCCNFGGELLQMAAPSAQAGVVFARGDFSHSLYASTARSQGTAGGTSTFGLKLAGRAPPAAGSDDQPARPPGRSIDGARSVRQAPAWDDEDGETWENPSTFRLGKVLDHGSFNYRWPFTEYSLLLNEEDSDQEIPMGTCTALSFIKDKVLYQVLRIEQGGSYSRYNDNISTFFPPESRIALAIGGPVRLQPFEGNNIGPRRLPEYATVDLIDHNKRAVFKSTDPEVKIRLEAAIYRVDSLDSEPEKPPSMLELTKVTQGPSHAPGPIRFFHAVCDVPARDRETGRRRATFVAAFRLADAEEATSDGADEGTSDGRGWDSLPSSTEIYCYVNGIPGLDDHNRPLSPLEGPYHMWESIFLERRAQNTSLSNLSDIALIARCLEKTLLVGTVPCPAASAPTGPLALVSNLFIQPSVDLKSLFWRVRFLTKVHRFFSSPLQFQHGGDQSHQMFKEYCHRIESYLRRLVQYLVNSLLKPSPWAGPFPNLDESASSLLPDNILAADSSYYYVMITIWYVVKRFPSLDWDLSEVVSFEKAMLCDPSRLPADDCTFEFPDQETAVFLQWYHYGSLLSLSQQHPDSWGAKVAMPRLKEKVARLSQVAILQSAAKLASSVPYSADDEIFDRLAFLASELGFDRDDSIGVLSKRRIEGRDFTREISPGPETDGSVNKSGPWEVHALCHHSRLKALALEVLNIVSSMGEIRAFAEFKQKEATYKRSICHFINAEGTLVHTWERVDAKAAHALLCSEATAVVASTLLDLEEIWTNERQRELSELASAESRPQYPTPEVLREPDSASAMAARQIEAVEKVTRTEKKKSRCPIPWPSFAPPRVLHPLNFINSPDDTPDLYLPGALEKTKKGAPPVLDEYIKVPKKAYTRKTIAAVSGLGSLAVYDIVPVASDLEAEEGTMGIDRPSSFTVRTFSCKEDVVERLYDSLVDKEVRHRFLTVTSMSSDLEGRKDLMALLYFVAHPESASCLANHVLKSPRFVCEQRRKMWTARITLRCWRKGKAGATFDSCPSKRRTFSPVRGDRKTSAGGDKYDEPIRLPESLSESLGPVEESRCKADVQYHLGISSFVITTTALGDFSKCTIMSDLISKEAAMRLTHEARDVWDQFVHQPQTARCLVFLLLLRDLCHAIADEYTEAIGYFSDMISLDDCFKVKGWPLDKGPDGKFTLGLWSLESLNILQASLKECVAAVQDARDQLNTQIKDGPGARDEVLENLYEVKLLELDSSLAELTALNAKLERRIQLSSSYKDALSAILGLRASETSLKQNVLAYDQNRTIQKLTYLTIAYLPVGLMAAILAIDSKLGVAPEDAGRSWFIHSSVILLVITVALAAFLGNVVDFLSWPSKELAEISKAPVRRAAAKSVTAEPVDPQKSNRHEQVTESESDEFSMSPDDAKTLPTQTHYVEVTDIHKPAQPDAAETEPAKPEAAIPLVHYNLWLWILVPDIARRSTRVLAEELAETLKFVMWRLVDFWKRLVSVFLSCGRYISSCLIRCSELLELRVKNPIEDSQA